MKIAVYSGSFNPLHIGHKAIMEYLSHSQECDWVYLVVSPKNPLKDAIDAASGDERFRLAVEALRRHPELHVWVDDIELHMPPPQYTIRTLEALRVREPENEFCLVMGADNLYGIRQWRDYGRILSEFGVLAYPREGYDLGAIKAGLLEESPDYRIGLLDAPTVDISSTTIREGIAAGLDMSGWMM